MKKVLIVVAIGTAVLFGTCSAGIPGLPGAHAQVAKAANKLPKGIGGRAYLNSTGSIFTAKIQLPNTMKVGAKNEETYIEGEKQFTYKKGFRPGSTVQMTIYKNLNGNTRATFWGTNNHGYTGRIIAEIKGSNIGSISKWKTPATAAVSTESQRSAIIANFSTSFTGIKIDHKTVTPVVDIEDCATVNTSAGSVNITVKKTK
ncbi:YrpD family protein [Bacillus sonorensis]|uniref:YrpD family protein n=1 Tax=Bacillus sonorensis TaxID=119858 RepID=UPI00098AFB83|nr:YrpD family protein [Bacillus sonorensis]